MLTRAALTLAATLLTVAAAAPALAATDPPVAGGGCGGPYCSGTVFVPGNPGGGGGGGNAASGGSNGGSNNSASEGGNSGQAAQLTGNGGSNSGGSTGGGSSGPSPMELYQQQMAQYQQCMAAGPQPAFGISGVCAVPAAPAAPAAPAGGGAGGGVAAPPPPSPAEVAAIARARLHLAPPAIGSAPCTDPGCMGAVGVPVWLWVRGGLPTQSATASVRGVSVTITARMSGINWSMGDGSVVRCTGPGTPYDLSMGWAQSPDCGYKYTAKGVYTLTATATWQVTFSGAYTATETTTSQNTTTVRIGEYQALVTS